MEIKDRTKFALEITSDFEANDKFGNVAGNFEEIRDEGIAILLVEQNSTMALSIAHRA